MKHILILVFLFCVFSSISQEANNEPKVKNAFSISAGVFSLGEFSSFGPYFGQSYSFSYQVFFPNRFVFGFNFLTDRSKYIASNKVEEFPSLRKVKGYSMGLQLGIHAVRKEKFDLSIITMPHFNSIDYFLKFYNEEHEMYKEQKRNELLWFVPIVAWRLDFMYKLSQYHGLGLVTDVHIDMIPLELDFTTIGRLMVTYRISF
ncbi:hypothetical protein [Brumimicrobium aurantiacum]|uniref:Outer membrane protein beta-barrel domain-containing protein n=1 Tax=Brumimicrobium aurantiacum TaxID=1737063 RepID=A0A3E1EYG3_9FLAO|nr:hypothetical protein [Brumimicrobium aurantiacum]RFC54586.1 hypothetical protein DXU93_06240 [Brumimicrobium aurantiacum]